MKPVVLSRKKVIQFGVTRLDKVELDLGHTRKTIPTVVYPEVVVVVPLLDARTVLMTKEYRPVIKKTLYGFPGGKANKEKNLRKAALRELVEETGYAAHSVKKLIQYYPLVGLTPMQVHVFLAKEFTKTTQRLDEDEHIAVMKVKLKDIPRLVVSGKIAESKTLIGILLLEKHLKRRIL